MNVNWSFVSKQMELDETPKRVNETVVELLRVLQDSTLSDDEIRMGLDRFHKLALGHAIFTPKNEQWIPVVPGYYSIGDTIMVRPDAYDGEKGTRHNGRRGKVTASRNAQVVIRYDDAKNSDELFHHPPARLLRLM